jgi:uncharacterized cupin superfamily protein
VIPEAPLESTAVGLVPAAGEGWFVVNARDGRWIHRDGRGELLPLTGWWEQEASAEVMFPQFGVNLFVLGPGEPMSVYHGEDAQEDFLVLVGECVLVVEGQERHLRQWDFFHCPPWTDHTIVGAGGGLCVVLATGSRGGDGIRFPFDTTATKHGAGALSDNDDEPYARFPESEPTRYRDGWLSS